MLKIQGLGKRSSESGVKVLSRLFAQPIVNVNTIKNWTGFTRDGAYKTINRFIDLGILEPKELDKNTGNPTLIRDTWRSSTTNNQEQHKRSRNHGLKRSIPCSRVPGGVTWKDRAGKGVRCKASDRVHLLHKWQSVLSGVHDQR